MKHLLLCLLCSATSFAAPIMFEWEAPQDSTVTGYRLYLWRGTNAFAASNVITTLTTSATNVTWSNAPTGMDVSAHVVATNAAGLESDPSNVVTGRVPLAPGTLRIRLSLQSARSVDGPWLPEGPCVEWETPVDATRFYRGWIALERDF